MSDQWRKMPEPPLRPQCDLCLRDATWMHPAGGMRCGKCPRPTGGPVVCECHLHVSGSDLAALCGHVKKCPLFATNFTETP